MPRAQTWSLAAAVAAAGLLAGCMECGRSVDDVSWTEPGLYAHVDGGSFQPLYAGSEWSPPQGALPFLATFPGQPPLDIAVDAVYWSGFGDGHEDGVGFSLERDGVVTGGARETVDNATLVRGFLAFTANVTTAPIAQRIAWADEFQRTRRTEWTEYADQQSVDEDRGIDFYTYQVRVPGPFRLEALANETGAHWVVQEGRRVGMGHAEGGAYAWSLGLATWSVPVPHGDRGATLVVDPLDRVRFDGGFREGIGTDDVQQQIREAMAGDALPPPTFQDYQEDASIC